MLFRIFRIIDRVGLLILRVSTWLGEQALGYTSPVTGRLSRSLSGLYRSVVSPFRPREAEVKEAGLGIPRVLAKAVARPARPRISTPESRVRALSSFTVGVLAVLLALLLWATSPRSPLRYSWSGALEPISLQTEVPPPTYIPTPVPTPTPLPDPLRIGGTIAYTMREYGQTDIWAITIGSNRPVRLTNHPDDDRDPAWSPDGTRLAFASHRDGNWELYVLEVATGQITRLTHDMAFQGAPSWSPDGQWLAYESYQDDNLDIYIVRADGAEGPYRLTTNPEPDFEPAWSPGGREIAFVSIRDGNRDIYVLSLDDPREDAALNLTDTPEIDEEHPAWDPNGVMIAYSAVTDGIELVYAKSIHAPDAEPLVIDQGREPDWAPNGASLIYALDLSPRTFLIAGEFGSFGVASEALALPGYAEDPAWTRYALPDELIASGGLPAPQIGPLYEEVITYYQEEQPHYRLIFLSGIDAPQAYLNDRVDESFHALRRAVLEKTGTDLLGSLEAMWWPVDRPLEPGEPRRNWHMAGRAFSLNRELIMGYPPPIEVVREDLGGRTYWRVYVRAAAQDGSMGEPLRARPWDFLARTSGDVDAWNEGGRVRDSVPSGYYVDFTTLAADYGWERIPADPTWRRNYSGVLFWDFVNTQGLSWLEAMLEIYPAEDLLGYLGTPTPRPTETPLPTPTPPVTQTPSPTEEE